MKASRDEAFGHFEGAASSCSPTSPTPARRPTSSPIWPASAMIADEASRSIPGASSPFDWPRLGLDDVQANSFRRSGSRG